MSGDVQLVWLKRDLRLADHAPLHEASRRGPVLALYVHEPSLMTSAEYDRSHHDFIVTSLRELDEGLRARGGRLVVRTGEIPEAFERLREQVPFARLWSHEETGNRLTYDRDLRVARWCRQVGLPWVEQPQNGVCRPHKNRDGWAGRWTKRMQSALLPPPERIVSPAWPDGFDFGDPVGAPDRRVGGASKPEAVPAGEAAARRTLDSFLRARGLNYQADMSSPVEGWSGCSRLSPYLAWGNISLKTVYHHQQRRLTQVARGNRPVDPRWKASLESFESRLRWRCHFMQKLEDEPAIEFENVHRGYRGLRQEDQQAWTPRERAHFDAWIAGQTGYPLIDAVMRALHAGGWINFRMRAMLVSFACYHLWLHWRPCAVALAPHFLDFEPGIHFSQFQMQAGTTGINTIRIYNPIKQVADQDPAGTFIRRYVPELGEVPIEYLAEPHKMSPMLQEEVGCVIGRQYPAPVVDHGAAYNAAKTKMYRWREKPSLRKESAAVARRHGSRRPPMSRRR